MPTSEIIARPFDVVVVPFPYADQLAEKRRPALVVSSDGFNQTSGLVWVVMITSASNATWDGDILIAASQETGLPAASLIRTAKIATIDAARIIRVAGHISVQTATAVRAKLVGVLG